MAGVVRSLGRCLWPAAGGDPGAEAAGGPLEPGKEGGLPPPAVPPPPPPPSLRRRELEREARRRSREIDALLARERRAVRRLVRILLLGAGESGKSTFLKQMRIIHGREFDQKALLEFRATIYENVLKGCRVLVDARDKLGIPWQYAENEKHAMFLMAFESKAGMFIEPPMFQLYVPALTGLWKDSGIKEAFSRRSEYQLGESVKYFLDNLDRIGQLAEDNSPALTYDSDTETTLKKKMSRRPTKSRSPYTSHTCLHSKRSGFLRTLKSSESKRFESPLVKASRQYWRGSLKPGTWMSHSKSDIGIRTAFSPLPGSTPEYLKEALGMKKPKHARSASRGYIPGTPDYKEKEDMYDEIIELKKTIQAQKCEADRMKTRLRRVEEENNRKDKEIEQLLDPFRYSEFSWLRTEQKSESSLMISGLKQKILRLEQQCKEKDNTINQLQADMKNTDMEEMTIALHTSYQEIRRLQDLLTHSRVVQRKASESRHQKVLSTALFQLSERMKELQDQNERLKADMDHALSCFLSPSQAKNYLALQRQKLVQWISDGGKEVEEGLRPSETSEGLLLPPTASEEVDHSVAKESVLPAEHEPLRKTVVGLRDHILVLQDQLAVKGVEIQQLKEKLKELEGNQKNDCRQARIDVTQPRDQAPDSSSGLCPLSRVGGGCKAGRGEEEEEEEKAAAVRLIRPAFSAHVTQASLEEHKPLPSSAGREKAGEEKVGWSIFKYSPLVFTSDSATTSHDQWQASPSKREDHGAESDDSDEIVTTTSSCP